MQIPSVSFLGFSCPQCHSEWGFFRVIDGLTEYTCRNYCGSDEKTIKYYNEIESKNRKESSQHSYLKQQEQKKQKLKLQMEPMYRNAEISMLKMEISDLKTIKNWIEKGKNFFVFIGKAGCGKTYACNAIHNYIINLDKIDSFKYFTIRDLYKTLHKAIENKHNTDDFIKYYSEKDILILDDVGSSSNTEWQKEVLLDLIDSRYSSQKKTMITSNLDYEDMKKVIGDRLASRIFDKKNFIIKDFETNFRQ